ncbi:MAG: hypothetical protein ACXVLX_20630 [Ilumatobacteraceae bacterium]
MPERSELPELPEQPVSDESGDLSIERSVDLDLDVDALWTLLSTADGWRSWLVDDADIDIAPDAIGTVTNDGVERSVRIESVTTGRGVGLMWWHRDDPSTASYVQLDIVELPCGRSHLDITERFLGGTTMTSTMMMSMTNASVTSSVATRWDIALMSLWLLVLPSLVMA